MATRHHLSFYKLAAGHYQVATFVGSPLGEVQRVLGSAGWCWRAITPDGSHVPLDLGTRFDAGEALFRAANDRASRAMPVAENGAKPSIIGRESFLMEALAKMLLGAANKHHGVSKLRDQHRGYWFEVQVLDDKDEPTGHIARVTVELDRLEQP